MLPIERQKTILERVNTEVTASVKQLQSLLNVNAMTLWRDLKALEDQGLIKRVRGGAMSVDVEREMPFDTKLETAAKAKLAIADYAIRHFVSAGDLIAIEGGTTAAAMAQQLECSSLTVLTNSLPVLNILRKQRPGISAYCSGGFLRSESGTLVGKEALSFFSRHKVGTFFISATGLDLTDGLCDPNPQEIEVKQAMAFAAKRTVLLIDSSKFGKASLMQTLALRKIAVAVCEKQPPDAYLDLFRQNQIEVHWP